MALHNHWLWKRLHLPRTLSAAAVGCYERVPQSIDINVLAGTFKPPYSQMLRDKTALHWVIVTGTGSAGGTSQWHKPSMPIWNNRT